MQENQNDDAIEIDLLEVFGVLLRRWWLIALAAVLTGAVGFLLSCFVIADKFESTTEIYILNNGENVTYTDLQMGTTLTKDYAHLITTRDVLEQVIGELELEDSYDDLEDRISVETPSDTRIVAITVTDKDPARAQAIANAVREAASEHITNVTAVDAVNVASMANYPLKPSSPSIPMWTIVGFLIGGVLYAGIILVKYLLDDTIKTPDDVEKFLNLSTLGRIPTNDEKEAKKDSRKEHYNKKLFQDMEDEEDTLEGIDLSGIPDREEVR